MSQNSETSESADQQPDPTAVVEFQPTPTPTLAAENMEQLRKAAMRLGVMECADGAKEGET